MSIFKNLSKFVAVMAQSIFAHKDGSVRLVARVYNDQTQALSLFVADRYLSGIEFRQHFVAGFAAGVATGVIFLLHCDFLHIFELGHGQHPGTKVSDHRIFHARPHYWLRSIMNFTKSAGREHINLATSRAASDVSKKAAVIPAVAPGADRHSDSNIEVGESASVAPPAQTSRRGLLMNTIVSTASITAATALAPAASAALLEIDPSGNDSKLLSLGAQLDSVEEEWLALRAEGTSKRRSLKSGCSRLPAFSFATPRP